MQLIFLFLMILPQTYADYPALKAVLSEKGLRDVSEMMGVWIQSKLKSTEIPEVRGGVDIGIGTVDYVISNMHIGQCSMSGPSLEFVKGSGVSVEVSQLSLAIKGHWTTRFGIIHDGGSLDLAVYNTKIKTILELQDDAGRLSINTIFCGDNVGGVHIQFHGGASFFFQPFVSHFSGQISKMIHMKEIPVNISMDQYVYLSVLLTSSPAVTNQSFELDMKGEFYSNSSPSEPPFFPSKFDFQFEENYMLSLAASEFLVNSAAYAYLSSEVLQININDSMIPKNLPFHLNTSQFGAFIPQLSTLYPNMEMEVLIYASETPLFSFNSGAIDVNVLAAGKFSVVKPDGKLVPLFRLDVDASFSGSAQIDQKHLTAAFKMKNCCLLIDRPTLVPRTILVFCLCHFCLPFSQP
ncbi:lipopolysaccharide-binding protein isoform X2 [Puntigrus tetrazona]|uniref:lipopolysaccharide-binding protein isoform X2 n=1 Tax=Puntigrus tetrazona TaxID=1606681 RepID=UPI001C8AA3F4|nr:lipopolysaccharide-binding protein isoform X2 [Puntigrus tetrazona]